MGNTCTEHWYRTWNTDTRCVEIHECERPDNSFSQELHDNIKMHIHSGCGNLQKKYKKGEDTVRNPFFSDEWIQVMKLAVPEISLGSCTNYYDQVPGAGCTTEVKDGINAKQKGFPSSLWKPFLSSMPGKVAAENQLMRSTPGKFDRQVIFISLFVVLKRNVDFAEQKLVQFIILFFLCSILFT